jgi:hypothetical protein
MNKFVIPLIIVIAAIMRLIPHPPNFTPIIAMGLFSAYCINNRSLAILLPIMAMFISDLFLGSHLTIYWVYGSLIIITILGMLLIKKIDIKSFLISSLSASSVFFLVTNFGVWFTSSYYPKTIEGLLACYTMALPFFGNTLLGTVFYMGLLFVIYELLRNFSSITISDSI